MQKLFKLVEELDYVIVTAEEYDDGEEFIYDQPRVNRVDKYSIYEEFVILEIHKGKLTLGGLYDAYGKIVIGEMTELTDAALLAIAEIIGESE